ncbi:MAG: alpha/beta fold hydrolase [Parcubacteria group bacterium]|jgi:carboxylesterase
MNTKRASKIISKANSILLEDPKVLYKKEKEFLNQPFYFEGTNGKGVLLIHGWTTTSYELRRLGKYLNEFGYTVSAPLLRGHGTVPKDLENVKWEDWMEDVEIAYNKLKSNCNNIYVGGTSIGSCLTIMLAKKYPEISGLLLMATPYKIRFEKILIPLSRLMRKIRSYHKKYYPPTFGAANTITRLISYQSYSVGSALETLKLVQETRKNISFINQPAFLIQSLSDHVVSKNSLKKIYNSISSKTKRKKYIKRAYHTFISDIKNESVFEEILEFFNEN